MNSLISVPGSTKYLSGVIPVKFSCVGSFKNGKSAGRISLKIALPAVVIKIRSFCQSVNGVPNLANEEACKPILVCKCTYPFW